jgi:hypothetical protein
MPKFELFNTLYELLKRKKFNLKAKRSFEVLLIRVGNPKSEILERETIERWRCTSLDTFFTRRTDRFTVR